MANIIRVYARHPVGSKFLILCDWLEGGKAFPGLLNIGVWRFLVNWMVQGSIIFSIYFFFAWVNTKKIYDVGRIINILTPGNWVCRKQFIFTYNWNMWNVCKFLLISTALLSITSHMNRYPSFLLLYSI